MKFGLLHLVAANLVTWALTIVLEASGAFYHLTQTEHTSQRYNQSGK